MPQNFWNFRNYNINAFGKSKSKNFGNKNLIKVCKKISKKNLKNKIWRQNFEKQNNQKKNWFEKN